MKFSDVLHQKYHFPMSNTATNEIFDFENILTDVIGDFDIPVGDEFTTPPCMNPLSDAYRPGTPTLEWASLLMMQPERLVFEDDPPPAYEDEDEDDPPPAYEDEDEGGVVRPGWCSPFELSGDSMGCMSAYNAPVKKAKVAPSTPPNTPVSASDECPVCFDAITKDTGLVRPRCGHSVCMGCFEKMTVVKAVKCPMCRESMGEFDLRMEPEEIEMTTEERYDHVHLISDTINSTSQFRDVSLEYMQKSFTDRFGQRPFSEADTDDENIFIDMSLNSRFVNYCASYVGMVAADLTIDWVNYNA